MICACIAAHARRRACATPKSWMPRSPARPTEWRQVIACCAGSAWMPVRIRLLKLGSYCRGILSCRRHFAVSAAWCCRIRRFCFGAMLRVAIVRRAAKGSAALLRSAMWLGAWRGVLIGQNVLGNLMPASLSRAFNHVVEAATIADAKLAVGAVRRRA